MKVLLLGSDGMLGQAMKVQFQKAGHIVNGVGRVNAEYCFDLLDEKMLIRCVIAEDPDVIINTAAIINLEYCEENPGDAYCLNSRLPGILANICREQGRYFVQISTDHYYSGDGEKQHIESDEVCLINEYARTKFLGEKLALTNLKTLVIRTNIVGFRCRGQKTFVEWAIDEVQSGRQITLFPDFYTSSIHTRLAARIIVDAVERKLLGTYNLASCEVSSKETFVLNLSRELFGHEPMYIKKSIKGLCGTPRGDSLGLDTRHIEKVLGYKMPTLGETIKSLKEEYQERKLRNEV